MAPQTPGTYSVVTLQYVSSKRDFEVLGGAVHNPNVSAITNVKDTRGTEKNFCVSASTKSDTDTYNLKPGKTYQFNAHITSASDGLTYKLIVKSNNTKSKITKATAGKKKAAVKYKKQINTTKYQIQYKVKGQKWTKAKSVYSKTTKKTIKKLKKNKKYNIRVRAVRVANGKTYYGKWSSAKTVKVK